MDALPQALRTAVGERRLPDPETRAALRDTTDPALSRRAGRLLSGLCPQDAPIVAVTVLATSTIGPYEQLLLSQLVSAGVFPRLTVGDHGSLERELTTG